MYSRHVRLSCLVLTFLSVGSDSFTAELNSKSDLTGAWSLRIDAGGEIYKGKFQLTKKGDVLGGLYESDEGRRTKLTKVVRKGNSIRIETRTQRFSVPVTAIFIADVTEDNVISGEVDFSSGSRSRSYDFVAKRDAQNEKDSTVLASAKSDTGSDREQDESALSQSGKMKPRVGKVRFRQGLAGYDQMRDVEVWSIAPTKPLHKQGTLTSDGNNGGGESQVLMCFDNIIGEGASQIPENSRIVAANLKVTAFDPGTTVYVHRLFVPWTSAATWDRLANGISIDNVEASTVRDGFTFGQINMDRQSVEFDVTQTVQHWADGEKNHGWVFVNTGSNGWDFYSADWHEEELRPTLEVEFQVR